MAERTKDLGVSAARRKGTAFETAVVAYLQELFPSAERRALAGKLDRGDIAGVPGWTLELKNTRQLDLAGAVDEAEREAANAGTPLFAAVIKRRGKGTAAAYAVMPMHVFRHILGATQKCPEMSLKSVVAVTEDDHRRA